MCLAGKPLDESTDRQQDLSPIGRARMIPRELDEHGITLAGV